jgi:hypothetical protein
MCVRALLSSDPQEILAMSGEWVHAGVVHVREYRSQKTTCGLIVRRRDPSWCHPSFVRGTPERCPMCFPVRSVGRAVDYAIEHGYALPNTIISMDLASGLVLRGGAVYQIRNGGYERRAPWEWDKCRAEVRLAEQAARLERPLRRASSLPRKGARVANMREAEMGMAAVVADTTNIVRPDGHAVAECKRCKAIVYDFTHKRGGGQAVEGETMEEAFKRHVEECTAPRCPTCGLWRPSRGAHPDPELAAAGRLCPDPYHQGLTKIGSTVLLGPEGDDPAVRQRVTDLDERMAKMRGCEYGDYPWDRWAERARKTGVDDDLAGLGRSLIREFYNHSWSSEIAETCGYLDDGEGLIALALSNRDLATRRWQHLLDTDGLRGEWSPRTGDWIEWKSAKRRREAEALKG